MTSASLNAVVDGRKHLDRGAEGFRVSRAGECAGHRNALRRRARRGEARPIGPPASERYRRIARRRGRDLALVAANREGVEERLVSGARAIRRLRSRSTLRTREATNEAASLDAGWRSTMASARRASRLRTVSRSVSPFVTLDVWGLTLTTSAPSLLAGDFEGGACSRGRLEEQVDHSTTEEHACPAHLVASHRCTSGRCGRRGRRESQVTRELRGIPQQVAVGPHGHGASVKVTLVFGWGSILQHVVEPAGDDLVGGGRRGRGTSRRLLKREPLLCAEAPGAATKNGEPARAARVCAPAAASHPRRSARRHAAERGDDAFGHGGRVDEVEHAEAEGYPEKDAPADGNEEEEVDGGIRVLARPGDGDCCDCGRGSVDEVRMKTTVGRNGAHADDDQVARKHGSGQEENDAPPAPPPLEWEPCKVEPEKREKKRCDQLGRARDRNPK